MSCYGFGKAELLLELDSFFVAFWIWDIHPEGTSC